MQKPTISIVIPCWNSRAQLESNLPCVLKAASAAKAEIIVVDDASSQDDSVEYLLSLNSKITLIQNKDNLGFAATVNIGVAAASSDIVVLLNTDVKPDEGCFINTQKYFDNPDIFAVTFNSNEAVASGYWQKGLFHHRKQSTNPTGETYSLWAMGGQAAFDRKKYLKLKGMDTMYKPFYWEDTDLGYQAWKRGWKIVFGHDCLVVHDHATSVIRAGFAKSYIRDIAQRNQFLFIWKNITDRKLLFNHLLYLPYYLLKYPVAVFEASLLLPFALRTRARIRPFQKVSDQQIFRLWSR